MHVWLIVHQYRVKNRVLHTTRLHGPVARPVHASSTSCEVRTFERERDQVVCSVMGASFYRGYS